MDLISLFLKVDTGMPSFQPFLCRKRVDRVGPRHGHPKEANDLVPRLD